MGRLSPARRLELREELVGVVDVLSAVDLGDHTPGKPASVTGRRWTRRSRTPAPSSTPTSARSSAGTSAPRPARRSGWRRPRRYKFDPLKDVQELRRPQAVRPLRGRLAARRPGAPLGAEGPARTSRATSSRPAAPPASPRAASSSTTSASTTRCSATRCRTSSSPRGRNWLMLGPSGPRRLRLAVEHLCQYRGGICFCVDLDPRWVVKLIKKGWMEHLKAYQEHCHRPGDDDPVGRARHQVHVHDAEAARRPVPAAGEGGLEHRQGRHHRHLLRRHRDDVAVDPLRDRGVPRPGRLHRADLRQHADGPGRVRHADGGGRTTRSPTTPRSRGRWPRWWTSRTTTRSSPYGQDGPRAC